MTDTEQNRTLALKVLTILGDNQPERLREMMPEDGEYWVLGFGALKRDALIDLFKQTLGQSVTHRLEIFHSAAENDRVAVEGEGFFEFADGRVYNNRYAWFFTIRNGLVTNVREYLDTALAEKHMAGAVPAG